MKVTYDYKQTRKERKDIRDFNKGQAVDWNMIKDAININYDEFLDLKNAEVSSYIIPEYQARVSLEFGDDLTGEIGNYDKPFANPTAAAAAIRAGITATTIPIDVASMYVETGEYNNCEDLLFKGIGIFCDVLVEFTIKDGSNGIFVNLDGSRDPGSSPFYILGKPSILGFGATTGNIFNMTQGTGDYVFDLYWSIGGGSATFPIINCSFLSITAEVLEIGKITAWRSEIHVNNYCTGGLHNEITGVDFLGAIGPSMIININTASFGCKFIDAGTLGFGRWSININQAGLNSVSEPIIIKGDAKFDINFGNTWSSNGGIILSDSGEGGTYNISGSYNRTSFVAEPTLKISDNSIATVNLINMVLDNNPSAHVVIDCGTAFTINILGSLGLSTTADPQIGNNITLNYAGPMVPEAPQDGSPYARQDAGWVAAGGGGGTLTTRRWTLTANIPTAIDSGFTTDSQINVIMKVNATGVSSGFNDVAMVLLNSTTGESRFYVNRVWISSSAGNFEFIYPYPNSWDLTDTVIFTNGFLPAGFSCSGLELVQDYNA